MPCVLPAHNVSPKSINKLAHLTSLALPYIALVATPERHRVIVMSVTLETLSLADTNTPSHDATPEALRQWACFPGADIVGASATRQIAFRLLVESRHGRIAIASVALRETPDTSFAARLASLIDERAFRLASRERIAGEFGERHGVSLEVLDIDLDRDNPAHNSGVLAYVLAASARQSGSESTISVSLSSLRSELTARLEHDWNAMRASFIRELDAHAVDTARKIDGLRPSAYNYLAPTRNSDATGDTLASKVATVRQLTRAREIDSLRTRLIRNSDTTRDSDTIAGAPARKVDAARQAAHAEHQSTSGSHDGLDDTQRRNRHQALAVLPFLQVLVQRPAFKSVCRAIDGGLPLVDALANHYGATRGLIRTLHGVTARDLGPWTWQLGILLKLLRDLPSAWWPRDPDHWRRFIDTVDRIVGINRHPITTSTNQLWLRRVLQNGGSLPAATPEDLVRLGHDIDEFLNTLRAAIFSKMVGSGGRASHGSGLASIKVLGHFKASLGLVRLSELVRRYGDAYLRAVTEFASQVDLWRGVRWPAIGDGPLTYCEVRLVPLLTPDDLRREGERMRNCVANYVERCAKGSSQLWSVHHVDGIPLSTLETQLISSPPGRHSLTIAQHKGQGNGPVPPIAEVAVQAHIARLAADPHLMQVYLDWRETISRQPLELRHRRALMIPVLSALERTLPERWSLAKLIELVQIKSADATTGNR